MEAWRELAANILVRVRPSSLGTLDELQFVAGPTGKDITDRLRRWCHDVNAVSAQDLMDEAARVIDSIRAASQALPLADPLAYGCLDTDSTEAKEKRRSAMATATATDAVVAIDLKSRHGRRLLKRIASGKEDWRLVTLPRVDWRIVLIRATSGLDETEIVTSERVTIERPFRDEYDLPAVECVGAWLLGSDVATAARLLLDGWRFRIRHHPGSESSRELKMQIVEFVAVPPFGGHGLAIGGATLYDADWRRTVIGGSCSATRTSPQ